MTEPQLDIMGKMSNTIVDLEPKDGVFRMNIEEQRKQNLTKPLKVTSKQDAIEFLTKEQITPILDAMPHGRDKLFIQTLWMTGIRITEAINIEKQHVNSDQHMVRIRWLKSRKWNERHLAVPKRLLELWMLYAGSMSYHEKFFDFTRQRGEQITKKYFGVSPHVFRHSYAMHFLRENKDSRAILQLQKILGHARIQTTMQYLNVSQADIHEAINSVEF